LTKYLYGPCDFKENLKLIHNASEGNKKVILTMVKNCGYNAIVKDFKIGEVEYHEIFCNFPLDAPMNSEFSCDPKDYKETLGGFDLYDGENIVFSISYFNSPGVDYQRNKKILKEYLFGVDQILTMRMYEDGHIVQYVPKSIKREDFESQFNDPSFSGNQYTVRYEYHQNNGLITDLGTYTYSMTLNQYLDDPRYGTSPLVSLIDVRQVVQNGFTVSFNSPNERFYMNLMTFGSLICAMRNSGYNDFTFNGFSTVEGLTVGGSNSHKNGFNGDLRYLRLDASGGNCYLNGNSWQQMDENRQNLFNDNLFNFKWFSMLSQYYDKNRLLNHTSNDKKGGHYDHLHVQGYNRDQYSVIYEE
jgi:hypothetical protein